MKGIALFVNVKKQQQQQNVCCDDTTTRFSTSRNSWGPPCMSVLSLKAHALHFVFVWLN